MTEIYLGLPKEWAVAVDGTVGCSYKELGVRVERLGALLVRLGTAG